MGSDFAHLLCATKRLYLDWDLK